MKKIILLLLVAIMTFYVCACGEPENPKPQNGYKPLIKEDLMWNTEELFARQPKVSYCSAEEMEAAGVKNDNGTTQAIFVDGEPYKGKNTKFFAYIGVPSSEMPEGGYPAIVLVHGGGGCAFYEWVEYWNGKGFVAIAPDFYAQQWGGKKYDGRGAPSNPDGGPADSGSFLNTAADCKDSWVYHSVSNIILSHNILLADERVNSDKIGITGISWGGVLTSITSGVDYRFQAFAPVYGAGFITATKAFTEKNYFVKPTNEVEWVQYFDPVSYLPYNNRPTMFTLGTNDHVFPLEHQQFGASLCQGDVYFSYRYNLTHYHRWKDEEGMINVYKFMKFIFDGEKLPITIAQSDLVNNTITIKVDDMQKVEAARLVYTKSKGKDHRTYEWTSANITVDKTKSTLSVKIPTGTTYCFVELRDGEFYEFFASTEFYQL